MTFLYDFNYAIYFQIHIHLLSKANINKVALVTLDDNNHYHHHHHHHHHGNRLRLDELDQTGFQMHGTAQLSKHEQLVSFSFRIL